jgi:hypothetical protein
VTLPAAQRRPRAHDGRVDRRVRHLRARGDDRVGRFAVPGVLEQDALPGVDRAREVVERVPAERGDGARQGDLALRRRCVLERGLVSRETVGRRIALAEPVVESREPLR